MPIAELRLAEYNPRTMEPHDLDSLKRSLRQFGPVVPLVMNTFPGREGVVVSGNQRLRVMQEMGFQDTPVIKVRLDPDRERALNVALNRISGAFEDRGLTLLVKSLEGDAEALALTGLHEEELAGVLALGMLGVPPAPPEYTEAVADQVAMLHCPKCGHEFPA